MSRHRFSSFFAILLFCVILFFLLLILSKTTLAFQNADKEEVSIAASEEKKSITYVDFTPTAAAMKCALSIDIAWHEKSIDHSAGWIELLALYSARNGGDYSHFQEKMIFELAKKIEDGAPAASLTKNTALYEYYLESYHAALDGMVGEYTKVTVTIDENGRRIETREKQYGMRVFSPIAQGYSYTDYDDFGASRSYGYKRSHLGHDMLGSIGTPIIAVEGGYVEHLGWNQYGGWRIGIRSFDGKRYYYYAHLRSSHPYADLCEGQIVHAGEVIGYLGMTGYSAKEGTNGISIPHLHLGLQLIFEASQIDGWNQIWLDMYEFVRFWGQNTSSTILPKNAKDRIAGIYYEVPEEPD